MWPQFEHFDPGGKHYLRQPNAITFGMLRSQNYADLDGPTVSTFDPGSQEARRLPLQSASVTETGTKR